MAVDIMGRFTADEAACFHEVNVEKYELDVQSYRPGVWEEDLADDKTMILTMLRSGKSMEEVLSKYGK